MINLIKIDTFNIILDMRYATDNNVTGKPFYNKSDCYLHKDALEKFKKSIELAAAIGLKFKVFDAFRPLEAQQILWDYSQNPEFVSNPQTGSCPHCRGVAVDLTLVDKSGQELDMGTGFDDFTPFSHHTNMEISQEAQRNRFVLLGIMTASGWDNYMNEWWHYQLFNARDYPLISECKLPLPRGEGV